MSRLDKLPLAFGAALVGALAMPAGQQLQAQDASSAIEEIVVTARKREESLQDVPVAVTALDQELLERSFITNLLDVEKFSPNVELTQNAFVGGGLSASIRGLVFDDLEKSFEPTVGVSVDGIFLGTNSGADVDLFDVESIEILRGPQGTLFGRNTIAGVINVLRTRPTGEWGFKTQVNVGRYEHRDVKAIANFPLIKDKLALKLSGRVLENNTFQESRVRNEDVKGRDLRTGSVSILATPSDSFQALLTFDNYNDNSRPPELLNLSQPTELFCAVTIGAGGGAGCDTASAIPSEAEDFTLSFSSQEFLSFIQGNNVTLHLDWDFGDYALSSITGYQDFDEFLDEENVGAPFEIVRAIRPQTYDQFSQELRLTSELNGPLNFVAGLYFFSSEYTLDQVLTVFGGVANDFTSNQKLDAFAVFGEATYDLNDQWRLTLGGRFTDESKEFTQDNRAAGYMFNGDESWNEFTHRISLEYRWSDDLMGYATWSTGFRSGGWNGRAGSIPAIGPFDPETLDNYEIGFRSEWFDNRFRLNATAFIMDYDDKQEQFVIDGGGAPATVVENAASASYSGLEIEALAHPFENHDINFRAAVGLLDADYDQYLRPADQATGMGPLIDVSDQAEIIYAPDLTVAIGGDYTRSAGPGELVFQANWKWTDDTRTRSEIPPDQAGRDIVESYGALDISATYGQDLANGGRFTLAAYGTDVLEEGARLSRPFEVRGLWYFATPGPRRNYGVQFGYEF